MKAVVQRVSEARVVINNTNVAEIKYGILVLLGIAEQESQDDIDWLCKKIVNLRIFNDENHIMNNAINEVNGDVIIVSQFTLQASVKKGNRPSYIRAARPEIAIPMYQKFIQDFEILLGKKVQTGEFGADMKVSLINDGPVTILFDTKDKI